MVLSKSLYRLIGTLVGCAAALVITALFPQDRTMLLASFTLFMALETALGSILRDFRSYGSILAGYTVAIISVANIDAPNATFDAAINRVAAIVLGIAAIAVVNMLLSDIASSRSFARRIGAAKTEILALAKKAIDGGSGPSLAETYDLANRLMPLRGEISHATPETPGGRIRARGARSALLALFDMIGAINAISVGMQQLDTRSPTIERAREIMRRALARQHPERELAALEACTREAITDDTLSLEEAFVLDRADFMIDVLADLRDGLRAFRTARRPRRDVVLPVQQDYVAVVLNAVRVVVAVGLAAILSVMSGQTDTAQVVLFTAVFVSLGSVQTDPGVLGRTAIFGMPVVIVAGTIYVFFVFPNVEGFPLFALSLAPIAVVTCWLVQKGMSGAGLIVGTQTIVLTGPANVQLLDPDTFVTTATMLMLSGVAIFISVLIILPVDPVQRQLRLVLAVGDNLRRALAGRTRLRQSYASRFYDRLSQFKTWQRDETVTLARRKTAKTPRRDRSARAGRGTQLARARPTRPYVEAELDARARRVLPSLSPSETKEVARLYLAAAHGRAGEAMRDLVRAAGALYATALLTTNEARLLRRVKLLGRWP